MSVKTAAHLRDDLVKSATSSVRTSRHNISAHVKGAIAAVTPVKSAPMIASAVRMGEFQLITDAMQQLQNVHFAKKYDDYADDLLAYHAL